MPQGSGFNGEEEESGKASFSRRYESTVSKSLKVPTFNHQCLARSKFFFNRDTAFLQAISRELQIELFPPGSNVITEGETGEKMYFLHRGEVEILVGPNQTKVAKLEDGNVFGEMALFGSQKRAATVRAVEACDCRVIHHRLFGQILKKFPEEQKFFASVAAERLGQTKQVVRQQQHEQEENHFALDSARAVRRASSAGEAGMTQRGVALRRGSCSTVRASILAPLPTNQPGLSRRRSLVNYSFMMAEREKANMAQVLPKVSEEAPKTRRRGSGAGAEEEDADAMGGESDSSDSQEADEVAGPSSARPPQQPPTRTDRSASSSWSPSGGAAQEVSSAEQPLLSVGRPVLSTSLGSTLATRPWQEQLCMMLAAPSPRIPRPRQPAVLATRALTGSALPPVAGLPVPERGKTHPCIDVLEMAARQIAAR